MGTILGCVNFQHIILCGNVKKCILEVLKNVKFYGCGRVSGIGYRVSVIGYRLSVRTVRTVRTAAMPRLEP